MSASVLSLFRAFAAIAVAACLAACSSGENYDVIIRGGAVYDGLGGTPFVADIGIRGEKIAAIGALDADNGTVEVDASGLAVSPGFINMLSWANRPLIEDGRALSDAKQGVTLEVMGEGTSMGPLNDAMKAEARERQGDISFDIEWTTLDEYLQFLTDKGVSVNVASYVGATTLRIHEVGYDDRRATLPELERMQSLVRDAMLDGALGIGSSLIYAPASFADTDELVALVTAAAEFDGGYISHLRSEGNRLEEAVQELIKIASLTGAAAEIYHLKASGKNNWHKLDNVITLIKTARAAGMRISANMYAYTAGSTGLDATMPQWVQEGGHDAWVERLQDADIRERVAAEMQRDDVDWENFFTQAGPDGIILLGFRNPALRPLIGKTLAEVAEERGVDAATTAMDLVVQDDSRVDAAFFLMSEENVARKIAEPWISFGSDAGALASEGVFLNANPHPRAYGNFARVLGRYSRDEERLTLADAIRRMTSLPASNLKIRERGRLETGFYADIAVFDPATIADRATFSDPHRYATGVHHVFVNGTQILKDGEHTGAMPGQVVRGPGWRGWPQSTTSAE